MASDVNVPNDAVTISTRREKKRLTNTAWAAANPEKAKESRRAWQRRNPAKAKAYSIAWKKRHREEIRRKVAERDAQNPERKRAYAAKHRTLRWATCMLAKAVQNSRRRGHPVPTITAEWIEARFLENPFCFYTGIALIPKSTINSPRAPWMPSLDRIDNSLGYTEENTRLTCWGWNAFRGNLPVEAALEFWKQFDALRSAKVAA